MSPRSVYYNADGKIVGGASKEFEGTGWIEVVPETIGERQLWAACHLALPK